MIPRLNKTSDYSIFGRKLLNREVIQTTPKRDKLRLSMTRYGFLPGFPLLCVKNKNGKLDLKDGQHRLDMAIELDLAVYYIIMDEDFDVAAVNRAHRPWKLKDYAQVNAWRGKSDYEQLLGFIEAHGISLSTSIGLLSGQMNHSNMTAAFTAGEWKIRDQQFANKVATIFDKIRTLSPACGKNALVKACIAVCRVGGFDLARMLHGIERGVERLICYGTQDGFLGMLEECYNFGKGRGNHVPLKFQAEQAIAARNACHSKDDREAA